MKKVTIFSLMLILASWANAQVNWTVDRSHSSVNFNVTHLLVSEVNGQFKIFDGKINSVADNNFEGAGIEFTVDVKSINTDNTDRDNHLKSDDFFNTEKFSQMKFKGTSMKKLEGNKYKLTGLLTIRDVTKTVSFDVVYKGTIKDPWGNIKSGFKATGSINRFDYNLKWNSLMEGGGAVVSETVELIINLELAKQK